MYIDNKKHKLSERQVKRFIMSCPDSINEREFLALVCMMADLYGFEPPRLKTLFATMINVFDNGNIEEIIEATKNSLH